MNANEYAKLTDEPRKWPAKMRFLNLPLEPIGRNPVPQQELKMLRLLIERFGQDTPTPMSEVIQFLRSTNADPQMRFTRQPDPSLILSFYRQHLIRCGALVEEMAETFEDVYAKYASHCTVRIVDKDGKVMCNGAVTEVYRYDSLIVFAVWDSDEPLAWAMVYLGEGLVRHFDQTYRVEIVQE